MTFHTLNTALLYPAHVVAMAMVSQNLALVIVLFRSIENKMSKRRIREMIAFIAEEKRPCWYASVTKKRKTHHVVSPSLHTALAWALSCRTSNLAPGWNCISPVLLHPPLFGADDGTRFYGRCESRVILFCLADGPTQVSLWTHNELPLSSSSLSRCDLWEHRLRDTMADCVFFTWDKKCKI